MVVFEEPGGDQPVGGRLLRRGAERVDGAVLARTGEGAVQHRGGGEVEWVAGVPFRGLVPIQMSQPLSFDRRSTQMFVCGRSPS